MYLFRVKDTARDVACCRRRLCVILELSTSLSEPKSEDHWRLVPLLFQILDHVLDPEDQWSDFDYPCQLLLTQLTICCKQLLDMGSTQAMSESTSYFMLCLFASMSCVWWFVMSVMCDLAPLQRQFPRTRLTLNWL